MSHGKAPAGSIVKLYVDSDQLIREGHVVETRSGRRYLVLTVRLQTRGKYIGRHHLSALVVGEDELCPAPVTHRIRWYKRHARVGRGGVKGADRS
jgi:hypothetical protein